MRVEQTELTIRATRRGCHLVTPELNDALRSLEIANGLVHLFIQHTSASLTINENADPDVRADMEMSLSKIVPDDFPYRHTAEGRDDMPAHVKASLMGTGLTIPVKDGRLALGTWQGVYLNEHRDQPTPRRIVVTYLGN